MFCLAMDPIYWRLNKIPGIVNVKDMSTTALQWANASMTWLGCYHCDASLMTCTLLASRSSNTAAGKPVWQPQLPKDIPLLGPWKPCPTNSGYHSTLQATCLAALGTLQPSQGIPWPNTIVARNNHYYCLSSEHARRLAEEGVTAQGTHSVYSLALSPCKCKAKTAIVTNTAPEPAHIIALEQSNFGLAASSLTPYSSAS